MNITISLNTQYGSLEDPRLEGYVFDVKDSNGFNMGSSKSYLYLPNPSIVIYDLLTQDFKTVFIRTSAVEFHDTKYPNNLHKKILVNKDAINNNDDKPLQLPTIFYEERAGDIVYAPIPVMPEKCLYVMGPSYVVYSPKKPHAIGGKSWIETDAELRIEDHL